MSLHLVQTITSRSVSVGQLLPALVVAPVLVDQHVIIAAGASAMVQVSAVAKAASHGHPGSVSLMPQWVNDVNGHHIPLAQAADVFTGKSNGGASSAATVAATAVLIVPGLFVHNFFKGGDVTITPQVDFSAQTAADDSLMQK